MAREIVKWFILCFPFFFSTFNYCFIYLIKHLTVIYFLSDTVKLGRPFIIKIIKSDFFPSGWSFLIWRIWETTIQLWVALYFHIYLVC